MDMTSTLSWWTRGLCPAAGSHTEDNDDEFISDNLKLVYKYTFLGPDDIIFKYLILWLLRVEFNIWAPFVLSFVALS